MASKRVPIKFNELEPRGRGAVVRTREEIESENRELEARRSRKPENQSAINPDSLLSVSTEVGEEQGRANRALYEKVTYRISPEAVEAVDEIKRLMRRVHGIKATREEIAEAAILEALAEYLERRRDSKVVSRLSGNPESRPTAGRAPR